jgi:hypothetical protein
MDEFALDCWLLKKMKTLLFPLLIEYKFKLKLCRDSW